MIFSITNKHANPIIATQTVPAQWTNIRLLEHSGTALFTTSLSALWHRETLERQLQAHEKIQS